MTNWKSVDGFLYEKEGTKLQELSAGKTVLEIGAYKGRSTCCFAEVAKHVYTIDPWEDDVIFNEFLINIDEFKDKITYYRNYAVEILTETEISADIYFIDGNHEYDSVKSDIEVILPLLKSGDIFIFHDYYHLPFPGVKEAVDEIFGPAINGVGTFAWYQID